QVAGDFYDVFRIKRTPYTAFVIADVCDKGVGAALFMVLFRSLLRAFGEQVLPDASVEDQILRIVRSTNDFVAEYHGRSNMFATIFLAVLDPESGDLYYVNGGHEPPVVLDAKGTVTSRLAPTGPAVGMFPDMQFTVARHRLDHGDCVVGFTDGTTDAKNGAGRLFTEERLLRCLANPWTSVFSMLFELDLEIRAHIGTRAQFDDITLLALRRNTATQETRHAICRVAEMDALPELREFVESAAAYSGLDHDQAFAFKSSADELCTNIVQHGYPDRAAGLLSLSLEVEPDVLARLVITDDGIRFDPGSAIASDPTLDLAERNPGGLGIYLAKAQMDALHYSRTDDGANRLVLEKSLRHGNKAEGAGSGDPQQRD
ncbi:MAG TPA: SpoIIE family protein phosphatase, partial [Spirochaetia bacterium]|nr:SpoIIE family protein phosphatase [Spirochaetia bacterium]